MEDMMSDTMIVEAELREESGRSAARRMRRAGKIPGIIYGGGKPELPISMDYFVISKQLDVEHFHTSMLEVNVKGVRGKNTVLLKDTQWDPIKDTVTHLDFFRVSGTDQVTVEVPVVAINFEKCPGIVVGGMLNMIRHSLDITCRADAIPEHIEVDCSALEIGDSVHVDSLKLPEGSEIHHEENFTVLALIPPTKLEAAPEEESEAAEADAPADAGTAEADSKE